MSVLLQADHREIRSGIPSLLGENTRLSVTLTALPVGDYIINNYIGIERKTAADFVQSIISNRLFEQISRLRRAIPRPLLIIEGNPYGTSHQISESAIRNAMLSVMIAWQVPVLFAKDKS
ncbi:MAG: ERCC4 domain-containing protein, partial [Niabella sp.]